MPVDEVAGLREALVADRAHDPHHELRGPDGFFDDPAQFDRLPSELGYA